MAVPKSKITKSRRGMRRSHDSIDNDAYVENKDTGELHRPHHIDLKTGMYNGKQILKIKIKYYFGSLVSKTLRPLYIPVFRSMWCGL